MKKNAAIIKKLEDSNSRLYSYIVEKEGSSVELYLPLNSRSRLLNRLVYGKLNLVRLYWFGGICLSLLLLGVGILSSLSVVLSASLSSNAGMMVGAAIALLGLLGLTLLIIPSCIAYFLGKRIAVIIPVSPDFDKAYSEVFEVLLNLNDEDYSSEEHAEAVKASMKLDKVKVDSSSRRFADAGLILVWEVGYRKSVGVGSVVGDVPSSEESFEPVKYVCGAKSRVKPTVVWGVRRVSDGWVNIVKAVGIPERPDVFASDSEQALERKVSRNNSVKLMSEKQVDGTYSYVSETGNGFSKPTSQLAGFVGCGVSNKWAVVDEALWEADVGLPFSGFLPRR